MLIEHSGKCPAIDVTARQQRPRGACPDYAHPLTLETVRHDFLAAPRALVDQDDHRAPPTEAREVLAAVPADIGHDRRTTYE
jgi:hypothetical protein